MDLETKIENVENVEDKAANETPNEISKTESKTRVTLECTIIQNKEESGIVLSAAEECKDVNVVATIKKMNSFFENEVEVNEDARSLGDLDSLAAGDELALTAAGSDSGVEGCGRALSSGGGSRSCASSVVSCGSGCGSESSSVAGAPPRPRRRVNVAEPQKSTRTPLNTSTPRPTTAPRGPNLATRERARSREKPTPPEKPRPLTPKPRLRPTAELPNVIRESPALRAKPTKTSTARCRTPNSPSEEKRWPINGARSTGTDMNSSRVSADKFATLPRRRRETDLEASPKHESTPPSSRRPVVSRSVSSRTSTRTRVRIYAEKTSQTVLLGSDITAALSGTAPDIERRSEVSRCHRGVQASSRDTELTRACSRATRSEEIALEEKTRRERAEAQLAEERTARLSAHAELEANSLKLLELAGAGAGAGAEGCMRALEEQLRASGELASQQRMEIERLRDQCAQLQAECSSSSSRCSSLSSRLREAEREAAEMQDFLAAETGALNDSLRDAESELAQTVLQLERSRGECRQLVRLCEQRRQETLSMAARARCGEARGGAGRALDSLAKRLRTLTSAVVRAYRLPANALEPTVYHNDAYTYSQSDSGSAALSSPVDEARDGLAGERGEQGGLAVAVAKALRSEDKSEDHDDSADLLDSETEPCLVTDPECLDEWCEGAWSGSELSPMRDEGEGGSEHESLRTLSAAIAQRQRSEAEGGRGSLLERVVDVDNGLSALLRALAAAAAVADADSDHESVKLANNIRDKIDITEKNIADVIVKKLAELEASKNMMDQYRQSIETLKNQLAVADDDNMECVEKELSTCDESDRRAMYDALDGALGALVSRQNAVCQWPRLNTIQTRLERLAFLLAAPPPTSQLQAA